MFSAGRYIAATPFQTIKCATLCHIPRYPSICTHLIKRLPRIFSMEPPSTPLNVSPYHSASLHLPPPPSTSPAASTLHFRTTPSTSCHLSPTPSSSLHHPPFPSISLPPPPSTTLPPTPSSSVHLPPPPSTTGHLLTPPPPKADRCACELSSPQTHLHQRSHQPLFTSSLT